MHTAIKMGYEIQVEIPEGVEARVENRVLMVKGAKGENKRKIVNPNLNFEVKDNKMIIKADKDTKREKKLVNTFRAHVTNLFQGASEGHKYVLKICSSHFPMNVTVNNNVLTIKNFIGEKYPRNLPIKEGVKVNVEGDLINVEGVDKELVGMAASDIEKLTKRPGFDTRIFQDGIYIINKDGKEIK